MPRAPPTRLPTASCSCVTPPARNILDPLRRGTPRGTCRRRGRAPSARRADLALTLIRTVDGGRPAIGEQVLVLRPSDLLRPSNVLRRNDPELTLRRAELAGRDSGEGRNDPCLGTEIPVGHDAPQATPRLGSKLDRSPRMSVGCTLPAAGAGQFAAAAGSTLRRTCSPGPRGTRSRQERGKPCRLRHRSFWSRAGRRRRAACVPLAFAQSTEPGKPCKANLQKLCTSVGPDRARSSPVYFEGEDRPALFGVQGRREQEAQCVLQGVQARRGQVLRHGRSR